MTVNERSAYILVLKKAGLLSLWNPLTDERLQQIVISSGLSMRAKEVMANQDYMEKHQS